MAATTSTHSGARPHPLDVAVVALGAFLIFLVQPLAARALLPAFGGSASVWVTALVFFQVVLAIGYLLAHVIRTNLPPGLQAATLVLLSWGAVLKLPLLPDGSAALAGDPSWQLLRLLALSVGLPFLVLATAGPLIQSWAAARDGGTARGRDVYSLYAISNAASLLALVSYPFLVEPLWGVMTQGRIWEGLFAVEVLLLLSAAWRVRASGASASDPEPEAATSAEQAAHSARSRLLAWLLWSAAGVMVLTTTSGFIGQEIAAVPLLWVIPLALYLMTWILAFSGVVRLGAVGRGWLVLFAATAVILAVDVRVTDDPLQRLGLALVGMTLACGAAHIALYRLRPDGRDLTRFYAAVAVGGAVGGILSGVVAVRVIQDWRDLGLAFSLVAVLAAGGLVRRMRYEGTKLPRDTASWLTVLLVAGCCCLLVFTGMERPGLVFKHRDFHGLVRVVERDADDPQRHRLVMLHGTTVHGNQFLHPDLRGMPTTYFGWGTGVELAIRVQQEQVGAGRGLRIGAVGLGAGTLAAHLRAGDLMRFYELSPVVAELATADRSLGGSRHRFSYLSGAEGETEVIIGDARLSLAAELAADPSGRAYDLMVLDAFAGDAVPVHLLTREAFDLYTAHLGSEGMIALHVSSNWLDLVPVAYAWADVEQWRALTVSTRASADGVTGNNAVWVLLFRDLETLRSLAGLCGPLMAENRIQVQNLREVDYGGLRAWTDDRSDLLAVLRTRIRLKKDAAAGH